MLANGAKLSYRTSSSGNYTELAGLKEIPEMGVDIEKVENTVLTDTIKQYEQGIGDAGDISYVFKFSNTSSSDAYRVLRGLEVAGTNVGWKEELKDGTTTTFTGYASVKRGGGGVNAALEFTLNIALSSALTINPQPSA